MAHHAKLSGNMSLTLGNRLTIGLHARRTESLFGLIGCASESRRRV